MIRLANYFQLFSQGWQSALLKQLKIFRRQVLAKTQHADKDFTRFHA
jgi:hypothetical protein